MAGSPGSLSLDLTKTIVCVAVGLMVGPELTASALGQVQGRKHMTAVRIQNDAIYIDGLLDEPDWKTGRPVQDFLQREPFEGEPATEKTEVTILYDDHALYVGARMYSNTPENVRGGATRRDDIGYSEAFKIAIDAYLDRRTSYSFGVTAAGVRRDHYYPLDDEIKSRDGGFDPVWDVRTSIDSLGWVAEMQIPFSQLRFYDKEEQVWGVTFNRFIPSRNEDVYWAPRSKKVPGWASLFGDLVGIKGINPTMRLEVMPYGAASMRRNDIDDPQNPFDNGFQWKRRFGADFKMGLGPHLTLDATVNPDFGQVEADPAVVNLTAFETIFDERRPFFIEGNKLLSNSQQTYFYSRRIGAAPLGSASGSYVDVPTNTTILAASKISGRLSSGLAIGALGALTSSENAHVFDPPTGKTSDVRVQPLTAYAVIRAEQEFGENGSYVGMTGTAVKRDLGAGTTLRKLLPGEALTGGVNWDMRSDQGIYEFTGEIGGSLVWGSSLSMQQIQSSSAHYFQRPDSKTARFDSTRTMLSGYAVDLGFHKYGGDHWLWGTSLNLESPGLELNDIGRLTSADDIQASANLHYRETVPSEWYHSYDFGVSVDNGWNFDGIRQFSNVSASARLTWKNFLRTNFDVTHQMRALSDNLTRGGPLMATPQSTSVEASISTNATRTPLKASAEYEWDEIGGWSSSYSFSLALRPGDQWEFSVKPGFERSLNTRQYVSSVSNPGNTTYGRRYIFSAIERTTMFVQFRLMYNFSPFLSLEVYAEPFAARGEYSRFGELGEPGGMNLRRYGSDVGSITKDVNNDYVVTDGTSQFMIANKNFNVRSWRSNIVLRWEWRLGSTLYLVWQQNKYRSNPDGSDLSAKSLWESLRASGDNIVVLKISYWIPVD